MNPKHVPTSLVLAVLCAVASPRLFGQATPAAGSASSPDSESEETVVLSPFVVDAAEDADSYRATSTLAGTRIRTDLRDVGSAIQVVTKKFMDDTGVTSSQDLLVYTTSTEVGGQSGNFVGNGNGATLNDTAGQRVSPQSNTRVRGLDAADNARDFFITDIPWDSYNVGRVDIQRGANSILFGIGSPAGVVNNSVNAASMLDSGEIVVRVGSFGTTRESLDYNKVIVPDVLAVRVSALNDETRFRQEPAFSHDQRIYGSIRFDPQMFNRNGITTKLTANFESGSVKANRPRVITPLDNITPWFETGTYTLANGRVIPNMNRRTYDARRMGTPNEANLALDPNWGPFWAATAGTAAANGNPAIASRDNPSFQPWVGRGPFIFDEPIFVFPDQGQDTPQFVLEATKRTPPNTLYPGVDFGGWSTWAGIVGYQEWARQSALPGNSIGAIKNRTLTDRSIFDFYNNLIDGPNKEELQDFSARNFALEQTFWNQKVGYQIAYDGQKYHHENSKLISSDSITVDIIHTLPNGQANPNVGRPYVTGVSNSNSELTRERSAVRATAFAELNLRERLNESTIGKVLGRHVFTGLYSTQRADDFTSNWYTYNMDLTWRPANVPPGATAAQTIDARRTTSLNYLGPSLINATSASGADVSRLHAFHTPRSGTPMRRYNWSLKPGVTVANFEDQLVGWEAYSPNILDGYKGGDQVALTNGANKVRDDIESTAFVWQGYFLDDMIVPTVGVRRDKAENFRTQAITSLGRNIAIGNVPRDARTNQALINDPDWRLSQTPTNTETGNSTSWSVVVHTPKFIREKLPFNVSLFYNESDNFRPQAGRVDIFNEPLASPVGETKDYGITLSAFDDRVTFKINKYKTQVTNSSLDGGGTGVLNSVYRLGANESWGYSFGKVSQLRVPGRGFDRNWNLTNPDLPHNAVTNPYLDATLPDNFLGYQPMQGQSVRAAYDQWQATLADFFDPANAPSDRFVQAWQLNTMGPVAGRAQWDPFGGGTANNTQPNGLTVVGDTFSEGTEYELSAQPVRNWNITINAAKTDAIRDNLASSFSEWVDARNEFYQGPAGDIRMWNSGNNQQTLRGVWNSEFYASYQLYKVQEGGSVPELRPWRLNIVSNYDFSQGRFKGVNVGGSYRWQDRIVVGYPVLPDPDGTGPLLESFDISSPYRGPTEDAIDMWVGYRKRLWDKVDWRVQLNIRNVFASDKLIPVTVQPDGSPAAVRIPEPRVLTLTNSFKF